MARGHIACAQEGRGRSEHLTQSSLRGTRRHTLRKDPGGAKDIDRGSNF